MILEQAERDRVQQLLCETLPAICQASLSGFADIKVDALIGITINKSDVFLVSIKETCNVDGGMDVEEAGGGRAAAKVNKIMAKTEGSTRRGNGRGRRRRAKRAASESEEEYVPTKKASQKGDNEHDTSTTRTPEQSEESPQKRSRVQRKSAVKAEASFQTQANEAPELAPDGTAEFSDEDFGGGDDDDDDYTDIDNNDDETEMTDIRQSIDDQAANLDRMIKQEPGSTAAEDGNSTTDGGGGGGDSSFLDRPFTASKASDDHTENTGDKDSSANEQVLWEIEDIKFLPNYSAPDDKKIEQEHATPGKRQRTSHKEDDGNYYCGVCLFKSKHAASYTRHKVACSGNKIKCDLCKSSFTTKYAFQKHREAHFNPLLCDICSKPYRCESGLVKHKRLVHLNEGKYTCDICDKKFEEKSHYEGHMNRHNGIMAHTCRLCDKKFAFVTSLTRHEKSCGLKQGTKPQENLTCKYCSLMLNSAQNLKDHISGMHEKKVMQCECGKSFTWRGSYYRHKRLCTYGRSFVTEEEVIKTSELPQMNKGNEPEEGSEELTHVDEDAMPDVTPDPPPGSE